MAVPSKGKAGSRDTWKGGQHRSLPCLCPRLCFITLSILFCQYKIAKGRGKLGDAPSPAQLLLHTVASWAACGKAFSQRQSFQLPAGDAIWQDSKGSS